MNERADLNERERQRAAELQERLDVMVQASERGYAIVDYDALDKIAAAFAEVQQALRALRKASGDYHQGCECSGSGVITECPGRDTEGCCGACDRTACECCQDLLVALYQADAALAGVVEPRTDA